ncbi:MAG: aromatic acid exporter family protein [Butyrivibrio sp.]|nr:aromatic acid exporter family protein [Muribaculum sp.]MCM1553245.1 aromatic acid exporter family protein [Butyrivibrio sp.]
MTFRKILVRSIKLAVGAVISMALARSLGLRYSSTAGTITVLSIGNTKRETLRSARNRGLAYLCTLVLAAFWFTLLGYGLAAFAMYLLCFALLCQWAGWNEAISMNAVLVTHFLAEGNMAPGTLWNETTLFLIGACMGILANLHLRPKGEEFDRLAGEADSEIKKILRHLSLLLREDSEESADISFERLDNALTAARDCAAVNLKNTFFQKENYEMDYITMRRQQSNVLRGIYENIQSIQYLPAQAGLVAGLLVEIEQDYNRNNHVEGLLGQLTELLREVKAQELPASREEFEARAILFYIIMQLENLLEIKRRFMRKSK